MSIAGIRGCLMLSRDGLILGARIVVVTLAMTVPISLLQLLLEGVQHVMHAPRHLAEWPDEDRRSRIVFIARDLDLDEVLDELPARLVLASARGIAKRARVSWLTRWSSRVLVEATDIQPVAERAGVVDVAEGVRVRARVPAAAAQRFERFEENGRRQ